MYRQEQLNTLDCIIKCMLKVCARQPMGKDSLGCSVFRGKEVALQLNPLTPLSSS